MPLRILRLQLATTIALALIGALTSGVRGGLSVALGGGACLVPNALFALRLAAAARRPGGAGPGGFFAGEMIKVGSTVALMAAAVMTYPALSWPWFLGAIVATTKSYFLAFALPSPRKR